MGTKGSFHGSLHLDPNSKVYPSKWSLSEKEVSKEGHLLS